MSSPTHLSDRQRLAQTCQDILGLPLGSNTGTPNRDKLLSNAAQSRIESSCRFADPLPHSGGGTPETPAMSTKGPPKDGDHDQP